MGIITQTILKEGVQLFEVTLEIIQNA